MELAVPRTLPPEVLGPVRPAYAEILTPDALAFVTLLTRAFRPRVDELLLARRARQARFDAGERPAFLAETAAVRASDWTVAPVRRDLLDRRVEITGPVDRKMVINALNSGADVFMADFEDSTAPTWDNVVQGQVNLRDAVARTIRLEVEGRRYALDEETGTLMVRPRGWHLPERHLVVDGRPVPGALFDFGLYFFHNARALVERGSGPYFYLPKLEGHREARVWDEVFRLAQDVLGLPVGTVRATVLIETLPAAFEMDEILWELRDHAAGLNCGRWDYIFSFVKTLREDPAAVLPDRGAVTMEQPFLRAYAHLVVKTCHRRGIHAMGGMAAQIPIKGDPDANRAAIEKVRADKLREVRDGHDGTWVAHPGLVDVAREVFDANVASPNQIDRRRDDVTVTAEDLLRVPEGPRSEGALRHDARVGVQYLAAWLRGNGCVPLDHLMEDAATAEISRAQLWQWGRHRARLDDGRVVTPDTVGAAIREEADAAGLAGTSAALLFERLCTAERLDDFLTLPAYHLLE